MAIRRKPQLFCILFLYMYIYIYIYKQCLFILIEESWLFMTQKLKLKPWRLKKSRIWEWVVRIKKEYQYHCIRSVAVLLFGLWVWSLNFRISIYWKNMNVVNAFLWCGEGEGGFTEVRFWLAICSERFLNTTVESVNGIWRWKTLFTNLKICLKTLNSKLWLSHMTLPLYPKTSLKSYLKMTAWTVVFILFYFYFCSFFYSLFLLFSSSLTNINNILVPDVSKATESKSLSVSQNLFTSTRPFLGGENVSHFAISW